MSVYTSSGSLGDIQFFRLVASHDTLANHYQTTFILMQEHRWSWSDVQNMIPFERDIYIILLKQWVDKKNEEIQRQSGR